jgi:poly(3-hydroxybutyrate) depolymerase
MTRSLSTRAFVFSLACIGALGLAACMEPDPGDTGCGGYLGCSAGSKIGPPAELTEPAGATAPAAAPVGLPPTGVNAVSRGAGCGKPLPADTPETVLGTPRGYKHYTVMGTGATLVGTNPLKAGPRTFWVRVPLDYDPEHAYRVVYIGQGCGGFEIANTSTLPLYKEKLGGSEQAIYVALDIPADNVNMNCYDNRDGPASQEWEAFELFHTIVDENYCVDNNRIYATGYSTGGWLANMWGCYFGGDGAQPLSDPKPRRFAPKYHVRAQAAVTGGEPANQPPCNGPVAALWIHDTSDHANEISGNIAALKRVGAMNGCDTNYDSTTNQKPWHPEIPLVGEVCKQFTGCPANYPVVFCTTAGLGHADQPERATTAFNLFFNQLEPLPVAP